MKHLTQLKYDTGLLWFSDDPRKTLAEKIGDAARRYKQKYGASPNMCYVHPSALADDGKIKTVGEVRVSSRRTVLLHHFWIGVEKKQKRNVQGRLL